MGYIMGMACTRKYTAGDAASLVAMRLKSRMKEARWATLRMMYGTSWGATVVASSSMMLSGTPSTEMLYMLKPAALTIRTRWRTLRFVW